MAPTIGRIVLVNIGTDYPGTEHEQPVLRPATVVRVWSPTCINVQIQLDGYNDDRFLGQGALTSAKPHAVRGDATVWATSLCQGDGLGQWNWPPRA
jgi:hypothetical protein